MASGVPEGGSAQPSVPADPVQGIAAVLGGLVVTGMVLFASLQLFVVVGVPLMEARDYGLRETPASELLVRRPWAGLILGLPAYLAGGMTAGLLTPSRSRLWGATTGGLVAGILLLSLLRRGSDISAVTLLARLLPPILLGALGAEWAATLRGQKRP
jgi:TRAP-type C4-dicarboxylate transport system permease large subunit